jgi:hypothetical protein
MVGLGSFELLQSVAQGVVISAPEPAFPSLPLARLYQVFQTPGALHRRLSALRAPPVAQHAQLILALPRYRQVRVFVFNPLSHVGMSTCPLLDFVVNAH